MDESLSEIKGIRLLKRDERYRIHSSYRYRFTIDPNEFGTEHDVLVDAPGKVRLGFTDITLIPVSKDISL